MDENLQYDGTCHHGTVSGEPCKGRPSPGTTLCFRHGGNRKDVRLAGEFRLKRDKAQKEALARLKAEKAKRIDTVTEMDRIAAEAIAFKEVCREQMEQVIDNMRYEGRTGEQIRAEVALYERALDRCNAILATNLKLGIAEKAAKLEEAKAVLVAQALRVALASLDRDQQLVVQRAFAVEMRAITAGDLDESLV